MLVVISVFVRLSIKERPKPNNYAKTFDEIVFEPFRLNFRTIKYASTDMITFGK